VVWAAPTETLKQVYSKMQLFDLSQIPVMEGRTLAGIVDEFEVLLKVAESDAGWESPVGQVMRRLFETIDVKSPATELLPAMQRSRAVCVMDKGEFLGLITPTDFLNYLRKRTGQA
jgi:cystathionine beta-synthase